MPVNGLVVTLDDEAAAGAVAAAVAAAGPFTVGERFGTRLSVALDVATESDAERWHAWLAGLAGVRAVDVAFVYFDDPDRTQGATEGP
ncbi:MAG: hypothetical protein U0736_27740 [Gemmataceae bacterium]